MTHSKAQLWTGVLLIWLSHLTIDFMLGVWPVYKTLITLDLFTAGLIASCGMLIGEGLQLYFGVLSDRGLHKFLVTLGVGLTCAIPFLAYIQSTYFLFICVLATYIGSGAFHPAGIGVLVNWSPSRKNFFIALFACGGMIGAALSQFIFMRVYHSFQGHTWILALPVLFLVMGCTFFKFPQLKYEGKRTTFKEVRSLLKPYRFSLGLLYAVQVSLQLVVLSFAFLLPEILQLKGYEEWFCLGGGYFYFILGAALTAIPISYCINKFGYKLVLASITFASAVFLSTFLVMQPLSLYPIICLLLLIGSTMGVFVPVVVAGGNTFVPSQASGFVSALYMGGCSCVAGFGPVLASLIASFFDEGAPIIALQLMSSLLILALGLIYFLPDREQQESKLTVAA